MTAASVFTKPSAAGHSGATIAAEDKRQITVVLAAAADGALLPLQLIFQGKTEASLSAPSVPRQGRVQGLALDSQREPLKQPRHHEGVHSQEDHRPFLRQRISELGKLSTQKCIVLMDCWSVHKSADIRQWLREEYPWLLFLYVPAGCTGKAQVCSSTTVAVLPMYTLYKGLNCPLKGCNVLVYCNQC